MTAKGFFFPSPPTHSKQFNSRHIQIAKEWAKPAHFFSSTVQSKRYRKAGGKSSCVGFNIDVWRGR